MYSLRTSGAFDASTTTNFVRVATSRTRIEPREPTVGFTVVTDRAFAEVIVATDPRLFLPENVSMRTPANYFASRAHGMLHGPGEIAYMLPAAFIATAVNAEPRPSRLYYLAASYTTEAGNDAIWSVQPSLAGTIPFVEIAADLHAPAVASMLGIALGRLTRAVDAHAAPTYAASHESAWAPAFDAPSPSNNGVLWRQEATGTLGAPRYVRPSVAASSFADDDESEYRDADSAAAYGYDGTYDDVEDPEPVYRESRATNGASCNGSCSHGASYAASDDDDFVYDDGHGSIESSAASYGLDSSFPAGTAQPADLRDDEDGGGGYGDEAEWSASLDTATADPSAAFAKIIDAVASARHGTLFGVARPTHDEGLAFGILQATQRSGELGRVLAAMNEADGSAFSRIFGASAQALLTTTSAQSDAQRMAPVGGKSLVDEEWRRKFHEAGAHPAFVDAQRRYTRARVLDPLLPIARDLGLATSRSLAMLMCILVAKGLEPGMRWVLAGVGPAASPAHAASALNALGHADVAAFQRAEGLRASGDLDVPTHARLTKKLRALGARAPVPVLSPAQMLQTIQRHASSEPFRAKLESLAASPSLDDRDI